jgi:hypothetical protein
MKLHAFAMAALALAAGCAPARYALPQTTLSTRVQTQMQENVVISIRPVNESNWQSVPHLQTHLRWSEPVAYWGSLRSDTPRDLTLPLVPFPSLEVTIQNYGQTPLHFDASDLIVEDSEGHRYPVLTDASEYFPQVLNRMLAQTPELWARRMWLGPVGMWPEYTELDAWTAPIEALRREARKVRLLTPSVQVAPGETWTGALVVRSEVSSSAELAKAVKGELRVHLAGMRAGERELATRSFAFALGGHPDYVTCSDGQKVSSPNECARPDGYTHWIPDGPCLQQGELTPLAPARPLQTARWINGERITNTEAATALLQVPASRPAAVRGLQLRIAGFTLIGGGLVGTVGVAAGIAAGLHDSKDAPAAVSLLALSGVGVVLGYLGHKSELQSIRSYNQYAFATGACARPL